MRYLLISLLFIVSIITVQAAVFNYSNDPFLKQNCPQLNNIYETDPTIIEQEKQESKKIKKSWFKKNDNSKNEINNINEGIIQASPDGSFYVFPALK